MYYMITWFGKGVNQWSREWNLNEKNGLNAIKHICESLKTKWFSGQLERGTTTGRLHIQMMLESSYDMTEILEVGKYRAWDWHVEPVEDMEESALYTSKRDTRVDGPWMSEKPKEYDFMREYKKRPWEEEVEKKLRKGHIVLVYDPEGGKGKTMRAKWLEMTGKAVYVPALGYKDIMRYAYNWESEHYLINIERCANIDRQDLWAGIELVSDGIAYDDRYESKKRIGDKPIVEIHANRLPKRRMISEYKFEVIEI